MVNKFRLTNAKPVSTPMETSMQYTKEKGPLTPAQERHMQGIPYAEAIGWMLVASYDIKTRHHVCG